MDAPLTQPSKQPAKSTGTYVAIAITVCAAAAALGFLARTFVDRPDSVARLLPSVSSVAFVRSTDNTNLRKWTDGPLIRHVTTGSGSTASGSVLTDRINAWYALLSEDLRSLPDRTERSTETTIALLQRAEGGIARVILLGFSDEAEATNVLAAWSGKKDPAGNDSLTSGGQGNVIAVNNGTGHITRIGNRIVFSRDEGALRSILETSRDTSLSLARSRSYTSGRLTDQTPYQAYVDYPKALSVLRPAIESERTWRDILTLFSPLEKGVTAIHLVASPDNGRYHLRMRVSTSEKIADAIIGTGDDPQAPGLPTDDGILLAFSGTNLLHGYQRFSDWIGASDSDGRIVLQALARFILSTYVSPSLSPTTLAEASRGGYSFVALSTGSGSTVSYGWIGTDPAKLGAREAEEWFTRFVSDSRLMFTQRQRPMRIADGDKATERYLSPLPSQREDTVLKDGTPVLVAKTGTPFSPNAFYRDGRLYFASNGEGAEKLSSGTWGRNDRGPLSGAWLLKANLEGLFGMTLGPIGRIELALSRTTGGLRIEGLFAAVQ